MTDLIDIGEFVDQLELKEINEEMHHSLFSIPKCYREVSYTENQNEN